MIIDAPGVARPFIGPSEVDKVDPSFADSHQVVMFQADVDSWWNLSLGHAIPAFVPWHIMHGTSGRV